MNLQASLQSRHDSGTQAGYRTLLVRRGETWKSFVCVKSSMLARPSTFVGSTCVWLSPDYPLWGLLSAAWDLLKGSPWWGKDFARALGQHGQHQRPRKKPTEGHGGYTSSNRKPHKRGIVGILIYAQQLRRGGSQQWEAERSCPNS